MTLETSLMDLEDLSRQYSPADPEALHDISTARAIKNEQALLDLAALAADLSVDDIINLGLEPDRNPLVLQALERTGVSPSMAEQSQVLLNKAKGAYFELLVVNQLNERGTLGELYLEPGQHAELQEFVHPGSDIQIFDEDGSLAKVIQLKAVKKVDEIAEHFEKYPDIQVASTTEIHDEAERRLNEPILDTGIQNAQITKAVTGQVEELTEDTLTNALDNTVEIALDAIPFASGVIVIASEGKAVLMGAAQLDDAMKRGAKRLGKTLPFTTAGAILMAASVPGVAVTPALLASRIWAARLGNRATMGDIAKQHADMLSALRY